ncbi:MAG: sodium:proton antiporter [Planctomycetes bacterium]|nr:sodium:proton antiporter [Planctomycetota bacterium]
MHRLSFALIAVLLMVVAAAAPGVQAQSLPIASAPPAAHEEKAGQDHAAASAEHEHHGVVGARMGLWLIIPFAGILLCIALCPLFTPKFWHHHYGKVAAGWGALALLLMILVGEGGGGGLMPALQSGAHVYLGDYLPFIILLLTLFTIAGGIYVKGDFRGTPATNTTLLLIGTLIASFVGTTGASMLMIQPVLRANKARKRKAHIFVFFIFLVSNVGGSLTPLGDPPLFLGFLKGVDFFWTMHLVPETSFAAGCLLVAFFIIDTMMYRRDPLPPMDPAAPREKFGIQGAHNLLFLGGMIAAIVGSASLPNSIPALAGNIALGDLVQLPIAGVCRDVIMLLMAALSLATTAKAIRVANNFNWAPIKEVAKLFAGIFICMVPALAILSAGSHGQLAFIVNSVQQPWQYFWATGSLSSFLDNAPTYLVFFQTAQSTPMAEFAARGLSPDPVSHLVDMPHIILASISCGAVFMGANTYIGNAPNFMVKAVAEQNDVKMPSFLGYMLWSICILIPLFIVMSFIFFR